MSRSRPHLVVGAVVGVLVALTAGACANPQESSVEDTAQGFYRALDADDGTAACDILAERTRSQVEKSAQQPCDQAIVDEDIPSVGDTQQVNSFGVAAQVHFRGETTFLSRFRDGWRVVAAGCMRQPDGLYDCQVEAG